MQLTEENYFSQENNIKFTGSSQIKDFIKCEACALAKLNGEYQEETSNAMMVSSYIDEYISGTVDLFKEKHPEIFTKSGELKADYKIAEEVIKQIESDNMFLKYLKGEHQIIMTGEISEVPVKIKIDSYFKDKVIVDLKAIKNFDLIWNEETYQKENFIDYYDYILQGALYQEIVRQNTGKLLPFIIAACTKEKISERALLNLPQDLLDEKMNFIRAYLPHLQQVKEGKIEPEKCGKCKYCKSLKKTTKIYNYNDYFERKEGI